MGVAPASLLNIDDTPKSRHLWQRIDGVGSGGSVGSVGMSEVGDGIGVG